ncbi:MAG: lamin tail domain-containing protein, partial [bacterium]|nr:lamin tail domain-containing protein [bacterium]
TEAALFALGHIVHLIQDASVPDHTRNDAHPPYDDGGSPYENWTSQFNLGNIDRDLKTRLQSKKPIIVDSLNNYFDVLATYSNNNFYSKDSIRSYDLPKSDYFEYVDGDNVGFKKDNEFGDYKLVLSSGTFGWAKVNESFSISYPFILDAYWSRLSTKSIQYGAGVINLFFQEAEKAKEIRQGISVKEIEKDFLALLIDKFGNIPTIDDGDDKNGDNVVVVSGTDIKDDDFELVAQVPLIFNDNEVAAKPIIITTKEQASNDVTDLNKNNIVDKAISSDKGSADIEEMTLCNYDTDQAPARQGILINEVAWMGTLNDANNEWIELRNLTNNGLDITGWQLIDMGKQIKAILNGKISAGGFYMLERTDDDTLPNIVADQIYVGALSNGSEGLRLFDNNCNLIDEVMADLAWPAGENSTRRSMERSDDLFWHTYLGNGSDGIMGTPNFTNTQPQPILSGSGGGAIVSSDDDGSGNDNYDDGGDVGGGESDNNVNDEPIDDTTDESVSDVINHILISEVKIAGVDAGDEFIELYNPTDAAIVLDSWSIQYLSGSAESVDSVSKKNFEIGDTIAARGFFLIARGKNSSDSDGYTGQAAPDLSHRTFSMSGAASGAKLFLVNNQDKITDLSDENIVDKLDYSFSVPAANQSLERKALNVACVSSQGSGEYLGNGCDTDNDSIDFEIRPITYPQNTQNLPEPRSLPTAPTNFQVVYNSSALELSFDWDTLSDLTYKIVDISDSNSTTVSESATNNITMSIDELGREYVFEIIARDQDGLESLPTQSTINPNGYFNQVDFYKDPRSTDDKYLLELFWDTYPVIPIRLKSFISGQEVYNNWQIAIFYYNSEAATTDDVFWSSVADELYRGWGLIAPNGFKLKYYDCFSGGRQTTGSAIIFPETEAQCDPIAGNYASYALDWPQLEDNHLLAEVDDSNFIASQPIVNQDYITVAYYAYQPGYEPHHHAIRLLAVDKTKYYFQETTPNHDGPSIPTNISFNYASTTSTLDIGWDESTDNDTLDNDISYRIIYDDTTITTATNNLIIAAATSTVYNFNIVAIDNFGNESTSVSADYTTPAE